VARANAASTLHLSDKIDIEDRLCHKKLRPCGNFAFEPLHLRYGLKVQPMTNWSSLSTGCRPCCIRRSVFDDRD